MANARTVTLNTYNFEMTFPPMPTAESASYTPTTGGVYRITYTDRHTGKLISEQDLSKAGAISLMAYSAPKQIWPFGRQKKYAVLHICRDEARPEMGEKSIELRMDFDEALKLACGMKDTKWFDSGMIKSSTFVPTRKRRLDGTYVSRSKEIKANVRIEHIMPSVR